jgi:hypothetical protein
MHNEKLHKLHSSRNIIRSMKSRSMRTVGHVACIGEKTIFCLHIGIYTEFRFRSLVLNTCMIVRSS